MKLETPSKPLPKVNNQQLLACVPLGLFLVSFIGIGILLSLLGYQQAFYQVPATIAIIPAIVVAVLLPKEGAESALNTFVKGAGNQTIVTMCLIFALSGAFAGITQTSGCVAATVQLTMDYLPITYVILGFFAISALLATAMGTSMGTLAAMTPIALQFGETAQIPLSWLSGSIISGAMFGDNLSIISDTTIAATRTQGCHMRDKLKANLKIAIPAALLTGLIFFLAGQSFTTKFNTATHHATWISLLPYAVILMMALRGYNVFSVLMSGIALASLLGCCNAEISIAQLIQGLYQGILSMQDIFLLAMLIGGLSALLEEQGGLVYLTDKITRLTEKYPNRVISKLSLSLLVAVINCCTANNTLAILIAGKMAKAIAVQQNIPAQESASYLDIFSCVVQGLLPYGAQVLLVSSFFHLSPVECITHAHYPMLLGSVAYISIFLGNRTAKCPNPQSKDFDVQGTRV